MKSTKILVAIIIMFIFTNFLPYDLYVAFVLTCFLFFVLFIVGIVIDSSRQPQRRKVKLIATYPVRSYTIDSDEIVFLLDGRSKTYKISREDSQIYYNMGCNDVKVYERTYKSHDIVDWMFYDKPQNKYLYKFCVIESIK